MYSDLTISHADPRPMYRQIMEQIRRRIAVGDWRPGQEIPSIRTLAVATRVSVITVKRAYLELERAGVIVTRQGRGSFVAENVDAGAQLRQEQLDEQLAKAIALGRELGLGIEQVQQRLADLAEAGGHGADDASASGDDFDPERARKGKAK